MRTSQRAAASRPFAAILCTLVAACSGGGGGGASPASAAITPVATTNPAPSSPTFCSGCVNPASMGYNFDTGIAAGPIAAAPPGSFGSAPAQLDGYRRFIRWKERRLSRQCHLSVDRDQPEVSFTGDGSGAQPGRHIDHSRLPWGSHQLSAGHSLDKRECQLLKHRRSFGKFLRLDVGL